MMYQVFYDGIPKEEPFKTYSAVENHVYTMIAELDLKSWRSTGIRATWYRAFPPTNLFAIFLTLGGDERHTIEVKRHEDSTLKRGEM